MMMQALQTSAERDVQFNLHFSPALAWHQVVQGMFQAPVETLQTLKREYPTTDQLDTASLRQQMAITAAVAFIQVFSGVVFSVQPGFEVQATLTGVGLMVVGQLALWLALTGGIAVTGVLFEGRSRYGLLLTLTGASLIPWALTPVCTLVKQAFPFLGAILFLGLWAWTTVLFLRGLMETFNWGLDKLLLALALPSMTTLWLAIAVMNLYLSLAH
jgi:hypothetical protein